MSQPSDRHPANSARLPARVPAAVSLFGRARGTTHPTSALEVRQPPLAVAESPPEPGVAWPPRSRPRRRPARLCPRRPSWRVVVQLVTCPAAAIHGSFCSEPGEKGGARLLRNPFVL